MSQWTLTRLYCLIFWDITWHHELVNMASFKEQFRDIPAIIHATSDNRKWQTTRAMCPYVDRQTGIMKSWNLIGEHVNVLSGIYTFRLVVVSPALMYSVSRWNVVRRHCDDLFCCWRVTPLRGCQRVTSHRRSAFVAPRTASDGNWSSPGDRPRWFTQSLSHTQYISIPVVGATFVI